MFAFRHTILKDDVSVLTDELITTILDDVLTFPRAHRDWNIIGTIDRLVRSPLSMEFAHYAKTYQFQCMTNMLQVTREVAQAKMHMRELKMTMHGCLMQKCDNQLELINFLVAEKNYDDTIFWSRVEVALATIELALPCEHYPLTYHILKHKYRTIYWKLSSDDTYPICTPLHLQSGENMKYRRMMEPGQNYMSDSIRMDLIADAYSNPSSKRDWSTLKTVLQYFQETKHPICKTFEFQRALCLVKSWEWETHILHKKNPAQLTPADIRTKLIDLSIVKLHQFGVGKRYVFPGMYLAFIERNFHELFYPYAYRKALSRYLVLYGYKKVYEQYNSMGFDLWRAQMKLYADPEKDLVETY